MSIPAIKLLLPEGFTVLGTEGPLKQGELERAAEWGKFCRGETQ